MSWLSELVEHPSLPNLGKLFSNPLYDVAGAAGIAAPFLLPELGLGGAAAGAAGAADAGADTGILTGGVKAGATHDYVPAATPLIEKAQKIEAVCKRHGVELGAAAMQFPLFHPAVAAVIPGALAVREVKENVSRMAAKIPSELWSELKREKLLDPSAPTPN